METYKPTLIEVTRKEPIMSSSRPSYSEALAALARKGHFSDKAETRTLAQLLTLGAITIERINPLDIQ